MFHYGKCLCVAGLPIIGSYLSWINKYAKHPEKYDIQIRYKKLRKLLNTIAKGFSVEFHVEGKENLPKNTNYCLISNHISNFDPLALICVLEDPSTFVAKVELEHKPLVGKIIKAINGLFLDRNDLKQNLRIMMKVEDDLKNQKDKNWIIFPEGTRNKDSLRNMREFHHGTFRPAVKSGVPIVPVAIYGSFRVLKRSPQFKKYPVFIKFLEPIYPEQYKAMTTQEIAVLTQERIEKVVSFELRKLDHLEMSKCDKRYRFNEII